MVKTIHKVMRALLALTLLFISLNGLCRGVAFGAPANAASNVLEDLQHDESFNLDDYPEVLDDYSLQVIQIAESTDDELFIYVYQPAAPIIELTATQINMSLAEIVNDTKLFNLTFLNSAGVFQKYLVDGVTVSLEEIRYYNITSIYRPFDSILDENNVNQEDENLTNSVAFRVGKIFTASTVEGMLVYDKKPTYAVEIIDPFTDYLICAPSHYSGGLWWWQSAEWDIFDSHFIAFSTDWDIDRLVSADISYAYRSGYSYYDEVFGFELNSEVSYGKEQNEDLTVNADDKFEHADSIHGFTYNTYSWNKINSTADFISQVSTSKGVSSSKIAELENNLADKEWVLNFVETERTQHDTNVIGVYKKYTSEFTKVSNVTILRLEFETDGKIYNLGAISNEVSSTRYPNEGSWHWYDGIVNLFNRIKDFFKNLTWWQWLLLILAVVLVVCLVIGIVKFGISTVIKVIGLVLKKLGQAVWWVISRPFVWIASLIRKRKEAAPAKAKRSKSRKRKTPKKKSSTPRTSTRKTRSRSKAK